MLLRHLGSGSAQHQTPSHRQTPLEILRERFARGEIDRAEYEERRKLLSE
ncbi:MAG: SHOCT domain-containing protein [Tistlia sp.]